MKIARSGYAIALCVGFAVVVGSRYARVDEHADPRAAPYSAPTGRPAALGAKPVAEAYVALESEEAAREQRFRDAIDPEAVRDRRRSAITRAIDSKDGSALARLGHELFSADLVPTNAREPASATRCAACHSRGAAGRAGGLVDDEDRDRDPPSLEGAGLLERLATEMTEELQSKARSGSRLVAHGVDFGTHAKPEGVGADLVVKPFGRDGRWRTISDAVESTARETMHLELAPDERAALSRWIASLPPPTEMPPDAARLADVFSRYEKGRARFRALGCAKCHVPEMQLRDGTIVRCFTDLKIHDMGASLGEKDGNRRFLTAPLWGVADSAPYLHDGRALGSLEDAILAHDGEGKAARDAYHSANVLERGEIKLYLLSLIPEPRFRIAGE